LSERIIHPRSAAWKLANERGVSEAALNSLGFLMPIINCIYDQCEMKGEFKRRVKERCIQIGTIISILDLGERFLIWMGVEPNKPKGKRI